eukprot:COSAG06_NODE_7245_length_2576_cov_1.494341_1_plen_36_part_00
MLLRQRSERQNDCIHDYNILSVGLSLLSLRLYLWH